jgi:hypothetical protein
MEWRTQDPKSFSLAKLEDKMDVDPPLFLLKNRV